MASAQPGRSAGLQLHWHDNTKRYELYRLDELTGWGEDGDHPLGMLPSEAELLQQTLDDPNSYWSYLTDYSHRGSLYAKWEGQAPDIGRAVVYVEARLPLMYVWQTLDTNANGWTPPSAAAMSCSSRVSGFTAGGTTSNGASKSVTTKASLSRP